MHRNIKRSYEQICEAVEHVIEQGEQVSNHVVEQVSAEYHEACEEINERLQHTGKMLRQGLRSEAIQECERIPNLLDAVAFLDISDTETWRDIHQKKNILLPPRLLLENATELNQAFAEHASIHSLLQKHRLLALGHVCIRSRLHLLRILQEKDPDNVAWQEDVESLERARIAEITTEADVALRREDLSELRLLADEVNASNWRVNVPMQVREQVGCALRTVASTVARQKLGQAERALNQAFASFDIERGRRERQLWQEFFPVAELKDDDPLIEQAAPALEWLAEEDQREERERTFLTTKGQLEIALDNERTTRHQLERLFDRLQSNDHDVPNVLEQRYYHRIEQFSLRECRRHRVKLVLVVGLLAIAGYLVFSVLHSRRHRTLVATAATSVSTFHLNRQWRDGTDYLEALAESAPRVFNSPKVQNEAKAFAQAMANDTYRVDTLERLEQEIAEGGYESEDRPPLLKLKGLAITDDEKRRIVDIETKIEAHEREIEQERIKTHAEKLKSIRHKLTTIQDGGQLTVANIRSLRDELQSAVDSFPLVDVALADEAKALGVRVQALLETEQDKLKDAQLCQAVTQAVGNVSEYEVTLRRLGEAFGDTPSSRQISRVLAESSIWETMSESRAIAEDFNDSSRQLSPKLARGLHERIVACESEWNGPLPVADLLDKKPFLIAIANRTDEGSPGYIHEKLIHLCDVPLLDGLFCIESNEKRYYLLEKPSIRGDRVYAKYVISLDLTQTEMTWLPNKVQNAPQVALARDVSKVLRNLTIGTRSDHTQWERAFAKIFQLLYNAGDVDPILRFLLFEQVLRIGADGSHAIATGFEPALNILNTAPVDRTSNWVHPRDRTVADERDRARAALAQLPSFDSAVDATAQALRGHLKPIESFQWIGWISREAKPEIAVRNATDGTVFVAIRNPISPDGISLVDVGMIRQHEFHLDADQTDVLIEGRPLYWRAGK